MVWADMIHTVGWGLPWLAAWLGMLAPGEAGVWGVSLFSGEIFLKKKNSNK